MNLNKNYLFVGGVGAVITVVVVMILSSSASMSLDVILANKDCVALEKWEEEHIYDENLNLTDEQKKKIMSVGFGCVRKAMNNMFGNSDSKPLPTDAESLSFDPKEAEKLLSEVLENKNCDEILDWVELYGAFNQNIEYTSTQKSNLLQAVVICEQKKPMDQFGNLTLAYELTEKVEMIKSIRANSTK